jgi:hypothetical protein
MPPDRAAPYAGGDRVALRVVGIQQAFWRYPVDRLDQLPAPIHPILNTGV